MGVPKSMCFKIRPTSRAAMMGAGSFRSDCVVFQLTLVSAEDLFGEL